MSSLTRDSIIGLVAALAVASCITGINARSPSRIMNGQDALEGEFPFAVSISRYLPRWKVNRIDACGGAIISPRHVLTAGHCIPNDANLTVYAGAVNLKDPNVISRKVVQTILHPDFKSQTDLRPVVNDIGILVLEKDLNLRGRINKVELEAEQPDRSERYVLASWGTTYPHQIFEQTILQKTDITLLDAEECVKKGEHYLYESQNLCGFNGASALCQGDSGSPLVSMNGKLVGIASRGGCNPVHAHVYTSVFSYRRWIESVIKPALH